MNPAQFTLVLLLRCYRWTLSPVLATLAGPLGGCRFTPTCSCYAIEAIRTHGALRGSWMAFRRLCNCHPWGGSGVDPVPPRLEPRPNRIEAPSPLLTALQARPEGRHPNA